MILGARIFLHGGVPLEGFVAHILWESAKILQSLSVQHVVFVPHACHERDDATIFTTQQFGGYRIGVVGLHTARDPVAMIELAEAIVVAGGNTFLLADALHRLQLIEPVRRQLARGVPYIGISAGAVVASPTIRTTNDWAIVQPPSLSALDLLPFQINPHYVAANAKRILEFQKGNAVAVLGLPELSWLNVQGQVASIQGSGGAVLYRPGQPAVTVESGADVSRLFDERPTYDTTVPCWQRDFRHRQGQLRKDDLT